MKTVHTFNRSVMVFVLAGLLTPLASLARNSDIEEVVVTGSLIKRSSGYTGSRPLVVVEKDVIEASGVAEILDLVAGLLVNAGSIVSPFWGAAINFLEAETGAEMLIFRGNVFLANARPDTGFKLNVACGNTGAVQITR